MRLSLPCRSVRIDGPAIVVTSASRRSMTSAARMTASAAQRQRYAVAASVVVALAAAAPAASTEVDMRTPQDLSHCRTVFVIAITVHEANGVRLANTVREQRMMSVMGRREDAKSGGMS